MTAEEAREALHSFAGTDRWSDHDTALFDGQIDNFAHALAEGARVYFGVDVPDKAHCRSCDYCAGVIAALYMIDPEGDE